MDLKRSLCIVALSLVACAKKSTDFSAAVTASRGATIAYGEVILAIPPNALKRDVVIKIKKHSDPSLSFSDVYEFEPAGEALNAPIEISFTLPDAPDTTQIFVVPAGGDAAAIATTLTPLAARATTRASGSVSEVPASAYCTVGAEQAEIRGKVFDDTSAPLDGVLITAKSLNVNEPFTASTTSSDGAYTIGGAPIGAQVVITAERSGYTSRRRVEVLKSNKTSDPNINRFDFGCDAPMAANCNQALSDLPEVVAITPASASTGNSATTSISLTFSEPMDRASVVDAFAILPFANKTLTALGASSTMISGDNDLSSSAGQKLLDKTAFDASWNADDTKVTFAFKTGQALPTDTTAANVPDYKVTFLGQPGHFAAIKDKSGISRGSEYFRTSSDTNVSGSVFGLSVDQTSPAIDSAMTYDVATQMATLKFSKPMAVRTLRGDVFAPALLVPSSYSLTLLVGGTTVHDGTLDGFVGLAGIVLDPSDPTLLHISIAEGPPSAGDSITITALTSGAAFVLDPAGNSVDPAHHAASFTRP